MARLKHMISAGPAQKFVSEALEPVMATAETRLAATGEPVLPREFIWHGKPLIITEVLRTWRETGPCTHGSGERYVRKHWFEVVTNTGGRAKIYFERKPRGRKWTERWWLFSMEDGAVLQ